MCYSYAGVDASVAQFGREMEDVAYNVKSLCDKRHSFRLAGALAQKTYLDLFRVTNLANPYLCFMVRMIRSRETSHAFGRIGVLRVWGSGFGAHRFLS